MSNLLQHFSDTALLIWLSLFPLTYLIHIAEEYFCGEGYSSYLFKNYGIELSPKRFLALQTLGLVLMLIGTFAATTFKFPRMLLVIFSAIVITNFVAHSLRSIKHRRYEPGLISAIVIWAPLGFVTLLILVNGMTMRRYLLATAIGTTTAVLVEVLTRRGGRIWRQFS